MGGGLATRLPCVFRSGKYDGGTENDNAGLPGLLDDTQRKSVGGGGGAAGVEDSSPSGSPSSSASAAPPFFPPRVRVCFLSNRFIVSIWNATISAFAAPVTVIDQPSRPRVSSRSDSCAFWQSPLS